MKRLDTADDMLAALVGDDAVPTETAIRLGRVRDDLGTYVLVTVYLEQTALPDDRAVSLLQQAVAAAQAEIQDIIDSTYGAAPSLSTGSTFLAPDLSWPPRTNCSRW
jgi:hypothetical protein